MIKNNSATLIFIIAVTLVSCNQTPADNVLKLNDTNSRYFDFRGQPVILMGSTEHYGALMNLDFDYIKYFDELHRCGLNLTRTFTGIYVEPQGAFNIEKNTLAPAYGRYITPFARSSEPGYAHGGNKFDLTKWDPEYFERLHDFMVQADSRDIIVEITLFSSIYDEAQWKLNILNPENNINGLTGTGFKNVHTLENPEYLDIQERMVKKIVTELNKYDNLYYEVCNEPYGDGIPEEWHDHIARLIIETEKDLPGKHLVSYNYENNDAYISELADFYSIINFHYAKPSAVIQNRHLQIPVGDNETGFKGTADWPYRTEAWAFMLAGGALFNHLDYSFAVGHEGGDFEYPLSQPGGGNRGFRHQLGFLRQFLEQLDFLYLKPDTGLVKHLSNDNLEFQASVINDSQYLVYLYRKRALSNEDVSIRFTGDFHVPESGLYTFTTISDDGVRLWANDVLIIDNWTNHSAEMDSGSVNLVAGEIVPVKVEYYNGHYGGSIRVNWNANSAKETYLGTVATYFPGTDRSGLKAEYYSGIQLMDPIRTDTIDFINHSVQEFDFSKNASRILSGNIIIELSAGKYSLEWIDPRDGMKLNSEVMEHNGGPVELKTVVFKHDALLVINKIN